MLSLGLYFYLERSPDSYFGVDNFPIILALRRLGAGGPGLHSPSWLCSIFESNQGYKRFSQKKDKKKKNKNKQIIMKIIMKPWVWIPTQEAGLFSLVTLDSIVLFTLAFHFTTEAMETHEWCFSSRQVQCPSHDHFTSWRSTQSLPASPARQTID